MGGHETVEHACRRGRRRHNRFLRGGFRRLGLFGRTRDRRRRFRGGRRFGRRGGNRCCGIGRHVRRDSFVRRARLGGRGTRVRDDVRRRRVGRRRRFGHFDPEFGQPRLQARQLFILDFDLTLQEVNDFTGFVELRLQLGVGAFLRGLCFGGQRLAGRVICGGVGLGGLVRRVAGARRAGGVICAFRRHEFEPRVVFGLGGVICEGCIELVVGGGRRRCWRAHRLRWRGARGALAIFFPQLVLARHFGQRFGLAQRVDVGLCRHAEHCATSQLIHVAVREGLGVGAQQRDHHALYADAGIRPVPHGEAPRGIRALHGAERAIGRHGRHRRGGDRGAGRRSSHRRRRSGTWRGRVGRGRRATVGVVQRGVEQHGVFTHHAAIGPVQFEQEVQEGFAHRVTCTHPDEIIAGRCFDDLELQ